MRYILFRKLIQHKRTLGLLAALFTFATVFSVHANEASIRHSVLLAGPTLTGILDEEGKVVWQTHPGARDAFQLPNGHYLITWQDDAVEFDKDYQEVWRYHKEDGDYELQSAQRLDNGNTLITICSAKPRLIEVNDKGEVVKTIPLDISDFDAKQKENLHMQTRMARKLENGNYLAPHLFGFSVREYTPEGEVVADFETDTEHFGGKKAKNWPFTAIRTPEGTTLVGCTYGNRVVEFDAEGEIVWEVTNEDVGGVFKDTCGVQRLPNGNTVIASYGHARGNSAYKLIEVTPDKEIVWQCKTHGAHHFQILTTNGKPLGGKPLK